MPTTAPPWFAHRDGDIIVFRVNRRSIGQDTLIPEPQPPDVFDHFCRMLTPGWEVVSGRKNQRTWRVGGVEIDHANRTLTGKLGWVPRGEEVVDEWSDETKDWTTSVTTPQGGRVLPFAFDGDCRLLAVVRDPTSAPTTIGGVVEKVLRENERELEHPTTEWSVEPVLDVHDFMSWLGELDVVTSVSFTAKLPNPEPRKDFEELVERMERHHATTFTETYQSKREEGLSGLQENADFQQAVAMGSQGFATLRGRGRIAGTVKKYSQTETIATERVDELPSTWSEMRALLTDFVKGKLRRFLDKEEAA